MQPSMDLGYWRKATDGAAAKIGYCILAMIISGLLIVLWAGIRTHLLRS